MNVHQNLLKIHRPDRNEGHTRMFTLAPVRNLPILHKGNALLFYWGIPSSTLVTGHEWTYSENIKPQKIFTLTKPKYCRDHLSIQLHVEKITTNILHIKIPPGLLFHKQGPWAWGVAEDGTHGLPNVRFIDPVVPLKLVTGRSKKVIQKHNKNFCEIPKNTNQKFQQKQHNSFPTPKFWATLS